MPTLVRPFTKRQQQIANAIGRGLTYAEIAGELTRLDGRPVSPYTIAAHVRAMSLLIDGADGLPARSRIYLVVRAA